MRADVLIPTYRPGESLERLLDALSTQSVRPERIILMNTEERYFPKGILRRYGNVEVHHLPKKDFDHGGTRNAGMCLSLADVVVCMTQDAVPADEHLIEHLLAAFEDSRVWAVYARQLPAPGCREVEKYTRSFNYPPESRLKGREDFPELGIKTFFCSNVCAAWRRDKYLELGGFEKKAIFNEDMILAGKLVREGGLIAYCADAQVIHSHNYSMTQQFHRNFDLAVSQVMHPEVFGGIRSESEGIRLVKRSVAYCFRIGKPWLVFGVFTQSAGKLLGYKLGQQYGHLPKWVIMRCTMNPDFWREK